MSSNLIGSNPFCQNDMACWIALRPLCHYCHLAAQTFSSMWCWIGFVFLQNLCHARACQLIYKEAVPEALTKWPRNLANIGLVLLDRIHITRKPCKWSLSELSIMKQEKFRWHNIVINVMSQSITKTVSASAIALAGRLSHSMTNIVR